MVALALNDALNFLLVLFIFDRVKLQLNFLSKFGEYYRPLVTATLPPGLQELSVKFEKTYFH
jgi:hypothetical protein